MASSCASVVLRWARVASASFLERRALRAVVRVEEEEEEEEMAARASVSRALMRVLRTGIWWWREAMRVFREATVVSWSVIGVGCGSELDLNLMVWEVGE